MLFSLLGAALFGGLVGGAAGALVGAFFDWLDDDSLAHEVSVHYEDVTKIRIDKKAFYNGSHHMDIGLFNNNNRIGDIEDLQAREVSSSLYEGKVIYVDCC